MMPRQQDELMELFPFLLEAVSQKVLTLEEAFLFQTFVESEPVSPILYLPKSLSSLGSRLSLWQTEPVNQLPF